MIVYEIENMETREEVYVSSHTEADMKIKLKEKGFVDVGEMFLAGHNAKGHEIIAMEARFMPIGHLKHVTDL